MGAATLGAYGLAALVAMAAARAWPADRLQGTVAGTMLAFPVFPAAVVWAFLAASPLRAWAGLLGAAGLAAAAALALGPHP